MKKVLIVQEGQGKGEIAKAYQEQIELYKRVLDRAEKPTLSLGRKTEKAAEVKIVETAAEAERMAERQEVDIVILLPTGWKGMQKRLPKSFRGYGCMFLQPRFPVARSDGWINSGLKNLPSLETLSCLGRKTTSIKVK